MLKFKKGMLFTITSLMTYMLVTEQASAIYIIPTTDLPKVLSEMYVQNGLGLDFGSGKISKLSQSSNISTGMPESYIQAVRGAGKFEQLEKIPKFELNKGLKGTPPPQTIKNMIVATSDKITNSSASLKANNLRNDLTFMVKRNSNSSKMLENRVRVEDNFCSFEDSFQNKLGCGTPSPWAYRDVKPNQAFVGTEFFVDSGGSDVTLPVELSNTDSEQVIKPTSSQFPEGVKFYDLLTANTSTVFKGDGPNDNWGLKKRADQLVPFNIARLGGIIGGSSTRRRLYNKYKNKADASGEVKIPLNELSAALSREMQKAIDRNLTLGIVENEISSGKNLGMSAEQARKVYYVYNMYRGTPYAFGGQGWLSISHSGGALSPKYTYGVDCSAFISHIIHAIKGSSKSSVMTSTQIFKNNPTGRDGSDGVAGDILVKRGHILLQTGFRTCKYLESRGGDGVVCSKAIRNLENYRAFSIQRLL